MEPLNKAERNSSIFNFVLVYLLITAIPVGVTYTLARKAGGGGSNQRAISEQQTLANEMSSLQSYVKKMEEIDGRRPAENASSETWNTWIQEADKQNNEFKTRVDVFQKNNAFTGARLTMRDNACSYLYRINVERRNYLAKRAALLQERDDTAEMERLRDDNDKLAMENKNLNTQLMMSMQQQRNAAAAGAAGGGGGGGGGGGTDKKELENLRWQLAFTDADCKKKQADLLGRYSEMTQRKQLYTAARQNFDRLRENSQVGFVLQRQASEKMEEIDKALARM